MHYTFNAAPDTKKEIITTLRHVTSEVERWDWVQRITDYQLEETTQLVVHNRAGILEATGPLIHARSRIMTVLRVAWWHRRDEIRLYACADLVAREYAPKNAIQYQLGPSWTAIWNAAPDRARRLASLLDFRLRRELQRAGFKTPSNEVLLTRIARNLQVAVLVTGLYVSRTSLRTPTQRDIFVPNLLTYICTQDIVVGIGMLRNITYKTIANALRIDEQAAKRLLRGSMTAEELQAELVASTLGR